ncbi:MAG: helix-turn-helix transcriptional regulator [Agathobacter sp.]|nr:helix-turn-helix transcriptional regulator [Agathobacter sp.]
MYEIFEQLMKAHGYTAYKVSVETGIAQSTLSDWKKGKSTPKADKMQKIADLFGVSLNYLMTGKERTVDYVVKTDDGNELLVETYYLNEETRDMAQAIFENKELRVLFDAARDSSPEDLQTVHSMLLALKRKEQGNSDEGC